MCSRCNHIRCCTHRIPKRRVEPSFFIGFFSCSLSLSPYFFCVETSILQVVNVITLESCAAHSLRRVNETCERIKCGIRSIRMNDEAKLLLFVFTFFFWWIRRHNGIKSLEQFYDGHYSRLHRTGYTSILIKWMIKAGGLRWRRSDSPWAWCTVVGANFCHTYVSTENKLGIGGTMEIWEMPTSHVHSLYVYFCFWFSHQNRLFVKLLCNQISLRLQQWSVHLNRIGKI